GSSVRRAGVAWRCSAWRRPVAARRGTVSLLFEPHVLPLEHHLRGGGRHEGAGFCPDLVADEIAPACPEEGDVGFLLSEEELLHPPKDLPALVAIQLAPLLLEQLEEGGILPSREIS